MSPEVEYRAAAAERLRLVLHARPDASFADLLEYADGLFPTELAETVAALGIRLSNEPSSACRPETEAADARWCWPDPPPEHPANFEWRFDRTTARSLAQLALHEAARRASGPRICCLGAPTVALQLLAACTPVTLVDVNAPAIRVIRASQRCGTSFLIQHDLALPLRSSLVAAYDVVVMDPPWYLDYFLLFLRRAVELLAPSGGVILTTAFPPLARSRAVHDWQLFLHAAERAGCVSVDPLPIRARFITPGFERALLQRAGLPGYPSWRTCEVLALRVRRRSRFELPAVCVARDPWHRTYDGLRYIAVRDRSGLEPPAGPDPFATPIPAISRSALLRLGIVAWDHAGLMFRAPPMRYVWAHSRAAA